MEMKKKHQVCEPKKEEPLYRIGAFAAMNRVTVKALRFYEERGLLLPVYINDENGYRYYSRSQMPQLNRINALKEAGFTLEEIKLLGVAEDEKEVLNKKKSQLLSKVAELTKQIAIIDGYILKGNGFLSSPVVIKSIEQVTVAYMPHRIRSYDCLFDLMPAMGALMERTECQLASPAYCFTNYLEPANMEEDVPAEICEAVTLAKEELEGLKFKTMPEVKAACAFHRGSYATISETYDRILEFIEEKGYQIDGPIRESYIDGVWNMDSECDWLTEIQIPIKEKETEEFDKQFPPKEKLKLPGQLF